MIRETEVDGVQTLLAPTTGPLRAGLTFRVGRADETLATAGITHLLEHLALFHHALSDYHYNGATGSVVTHFHMQGSEDDVVKFLIGVCDALGNLPLDRLETEKGILRTEAAGRKASIDESMPLWRHGARDHGLVSYEELGLPRLGPDDLRRWAATWFTRQNAVLWIAADRVPSGLRLHLPEGVRRPVPRPSSALPITPAYYTDYTERANGIVFDAVVRRSTAARVFTAVLEREMYRTLRQEGGYSYLANTSYDPRGDGYATVTAIADALPDKQDAVLGGFVDILAKLRVGRVEPADLDSVRAKAGESLRDAERDAARLPAAAMNTLTGHANRTAEETRAALHAVTVEDVQSVAVEASNSALLMVPAGLSADWAGYTHAPTTSERAVSGERFRSSENVELIVGTDGVSVVDGECVVTVRYAECAISMAWPDGARRLIGTDGIAVRIEPTLFEVHPGVIARIDGSVPPTSVVWMPARDPGAIPQPEPRIAPPSPAPNLFRIAVFVILAGAAAIIGLLSLGWSILAVTDLRDAPSYIIGAGFWLITAAFFVAAMLVWLRRKPA